MNHTNESFATVEPTVVSAANISNHQNDAIQSDDATWILTSAFIIFTMQSGFGLLEAGMVSKKNETNIMVKNAVDVIYGSFAYWLFGYGLSFGRDKGTTPFNGFGKFLTDADDHEMGQVFAKYFFHLSFATTATTIVSGAMAERVELKAYILFSFFNTISYSLPAHWMWEPSGWLYKMDAVDVAGCGPVHLVGGFSSLVATLYLKPRLGKFDEPGRPITMASPTNVLLGTFMLWWGWLGFNCGSTFGITRGKWVLASRAAVVTLNGATGGGIFAIVFSYLRYNNKLIIDIFVTGIISGLVSITAISPVVSPWESLLIGFIGGAIGCFSVLLLELMHIDDPVHCISTHGITGLWGVVVVGLVVQEHPLMSKNRGVFKGGSWRGLGVQILAAVSIALWTSLTTLVELYAIDKTIGLRMSREKEIDGADKWEHGVVVNEADHKISCMTTGSWVNVRRQWLSRGASNSGRQACGIMSIQGEEMTVSEF